MKLSDVTNALRAIEAGDVFWATRRATGVEFLHLTESLCPTERRDYVAARHWGSPMPTIAKLSERFYDREGWEDGQEGGPVRLSAAGRAELAELMGEPRKSVWS